MAGNCVRHAPVALGSVSWFLLIAYVLVALWVIYVWTEKLFL